MLSREILFFFSALGVFNVFLLAAYVLFRNVKAASSSFILSCIFLCMGIRVGVSCIYFFEHEISRSLIQLGLSAHVLMGVFLVEYLRQKGKATLQSSMAHIGIAGLIVLLGGILYPFDLYPLMWDFTIRFSLHIVLTLYLIGGGFLLRESVRKFFQGQKLSLEEKGNLLLYVALCASCLGFAISLFTTYILGPVLFSFIFYISIIWYYTHLHQLPKASKRYNGKKIEDEKADELIEKLQQKVEAGQLFLQPKLTLEGLAKQLHIPRHQLSQLLNDNLGKSYSLFINEYRIEYAKALLLQEENLSIEAIAYEVGFNSKSSFYSIFKKLSGETPASFKSRQLLQHSSK
ncbi:MAG: helix-turn-helix domain-containing protein [Bacteroidia bacterium]|nr:helix-turn-helix domain-containing protein [Bacteroidia bacterium]